MGMHGKAGQIGPYSQASSRWTVQNIWQQTPVTKMSDFIVKDRRRYGGYHPNLGLWLWLCASSLLFEYYCDWNFMLTVTVFWWSLLVLYFHLHRGRKCFIYLSSVDLSTYCRCIFCCVSLIFADGWSVLDRSTTNSKLCSTWNKRCIHNSVKKLEEACIGHSRKDLVSKMDVTFCVLIHARLPHINVDLLHK